MLSDDKDYVNIWRRFTAVISDYKTVNNLAAYHFVDGIMIAAVISFLSLNNGERRGILNAFII